jgi:hypothetical protein
MEVMNRIMQIRSMIRKLGNGGLWAVRQGALMPCTRSVRVRVRRNPMRGTNEKITEDEELRHQHTRCRIRSQHAENSSLGGMPQAPGRLVRPEAQLHPLAGGAAS